MTCTASELLADFQHLAKAYLAVYASDQRSQLRVSCDGQGTVFVVRFVGPGDPVEEPAEPGEWRQWCLQHPPRIRLERFDRTSGEYVEFDPKGGAEHQ